MGLIMSRIIVITRSLTGDIISIPMSLNDTYKQISQTYLCGRFNVPVHDIDNIVKERNAENLSAFFDLDLGERFWHLNAGKRYWVHMRPQPFLVVAGPS